MYVGNGRGRDGRADVYQSHNERSERPLLSPFEVAQRLGVETDDAAAEPETIDRCS
jgi:hypothetical protein